MCRLDSILLSDLIVQQFHPGDVAKKSSVPNKEERKACKNKVFTREHGQIREITQVFLSRSASDTRIIVAKKPCN